MRKEEEEEEGKEGKEGEGGRRGREGGEGERGQGGSKGGGREGGDGGGAGGGGGGQEGAKTKGDNSRSAQLSNTFDGGACNSSAGELGPVRGNAGAWFSRASTRRQAARRNNTPSVAGGSLTPPGRRLPITGTARPSCQSKHRC